MDPSVLLVDDDPAILRSVGNYLERSGYRVQRAATGKGALEAYDTNPPNVMLLDLQLPDLTGFEVMERLDEPDAAVIVFTGHGDIETAVRAMKMGADNFLAKPVDLPHLAMAVDRASETNRLRRNLHLLSTRTTAVPPARSLGDSPAMTGLRDNIELLAQNDRATVLITGESGTGKGIVARMIHACSQRAHQPFVTINCSGLNADSLDRELFGIEADAGGRRRGLFERADRGIILLDEVTDLSPELQPKLLRVLDDRTFRRVGGTREVFVDVRVIAASSRDLGEAVAVGGLRGDLYYRLSVVPLHLPALRERTAADRQALLEYLLEAMGEEMSADAPTVEPSALRCLLRYGWPGNVREMRNVIERCLMLAGDAGCIEERHLPLEVRKPSREAEPAYDHLTLKDVEARHIYRALQHHRGNRTHAARALGISRATLIKKIKVYELDL